MLNLNHRICSGLGSSIYYNSPSLSVGVRKRQVAILDRSSREMSLTVRIIWKYILSRVHVSVRPSNVFIREKHPKYRCNRVASACGYLNSQRSAFSQAERTVTVGRHRIAIACAADGDGGDGCVCACVCARAYTHMCALACMRSACVCALELRRYSNVFDESKINHIRWIAMFWTEYNDSLAHSINRMREWIVLNTANHAYILLVVTIPRIESSSFSSSTTHLR